MAEFRFVLKAAYFSLVSQKQMRRNMSELERQEHDVHTLLSMF